MFASARAISGRFGRAIFDAKWRMPVPTAQKRAKIAIKAAQVMAAIFCSCERSTAATASSAIVENDAI